MKTDTTHTRKYTDKQMGDAGEMLVAAELTLAGIPATRMPDNWPGYDVIAQPKGNAKPQRISVKSRKFKRGAAYFRYRDTDAFDWLALVIISCRSPRDTETRRRIFVIPRKVADKKARPNRPTAKSAGRRSWSIVAVPKVFAPFEGNFSLRRNGRTAPKPERALTKGTKQ